MVEKLGNGRQDRPAMFDPAWLPSSTKESGVVWQMEVPRGDEAIGFVSLSFSGAARVSGKHDTSENGAGTWTCRSRWLMDGNWCQHRAAVNTGPDYHSGDPTSYLYEMPGGVSLEPDGGRRIEEPSGHYYQGRWRYEAVGFYNETGTYSTHHEGNPLDTHGGRFPHPEKQGS